MNRSKVKNKFIILTEFMNTGQVTRNRETFVLIF